jgi:hypothetical protein
VTGISAVFRRWGNRAFLLLTQKRSYWVNYSLGRGKIRKKELLGELLSGKGKEVAHKKPW